MKALRFYAAKDLRFDDIEDPHPGPDEVKVAIDSCGICGTDLHEYVAGPITIPTPGSPHPLTGAELPVTMGHEMAGVVSELGEGVDDLEVGDRVIIEPVVSCGKCRQCLRGHYNLCDSFCSMGLMGWGGGYAESTVAPRRLIHPIPDEMSFDTAALVEPIAVGWHALKEGDFRAGDSALVVGSGPIGSGAVVSLVAAGASYIASSEVSAARRAIASNLGADRVIDPRAEDVGAVVKEETGGGVDVAFETSGTQAGFDAALASLRKGGTLVNIALTEQPTSIELTPVLINGTRIVMNCAYAWVFPEVISALSGDDIDVEPMITARIGLDDIIEQGFEELVNNKDAHVKIVVRPGG